MGTDPGVVFCFDHQLIEKGNVVKYNNNKETQYPRRVEIVRWFEANEEG